MDRGGSAPGREDLRCASRHPPPDSRRPAGAVSSRPATLPRPRPAALEGLCRDYWYPLYAFVRRKGHDPETAQDLVQGLFADLLERDDLRGLEPERGRFRSFLMACCTHHLARHHERERAVKRGGGRVAIPIDALTAESRFGGEPGHDLTAERLFERRWALTLLDRVLAGLDAEMARSGKRRSTSGSGRRCWATREPRPTRRSPPSWA